MGWYILACYLVALIPCALMFRNDDWQVLGIFLFIISYIAIPVVLFAFIMTIPLVLTSYIIDWFASPTEE
jgi:hypothetical protein